MQHVLITNIHGYILKGKDLLIRFTIEEAIDVDGGNAKSEREIIATVYIKIVVNHSLKALQHNNLYFKVFQFSKTIVFHISIMRLGYGNIIHSCSENDNMSKIRIFVCLC